MVCSDTWIISPDCIREMSSHACYSPKLDAASGGLVAFSRDVLCEGAQDSTGIGCVGFWCDKIISGCRGAGSSFTRLVSLAPPPDKPDGDAFETAGVSCTLG